MDKINSEAYKGIHTIVQKNGYTIINDDYNLLSTLRKGQLITGTINMKEDSVILNIDNSKVPVITKGLNSVTEGEDRLFKVLNVSESQIELELINHEEGKADSYISIIRSDAKQDAFMSVKEHDASKLLKERELHDTKQTISEILIKLTEKDIRELEIEGFSADKMTVKGLYKALSEIKDKASDSVRQDVYLDDIFISGDKEAKETSLINKLRNENLPITQDIIQKLKTTLRISDEITTIDERSKIHLIRREMLPSIENLYKAVFNNVSEGDNRIKLDEYAWDRLMPQVCEVIETAGYSISEDNYSRARWLIENHIPLTKENMIYLNELEDISKYLDKEIVLDKMVEGIKNGVPPIKAPLFSPYDIAYEHIIDEAKTISDEVIKIAVKSGNEINLHNLINLQKDIYNSKEEPQLLTEAGEIKVKRQLEEVRLKMTVAAAARLEKMGIKVDMEKLEKLVEELRKLEDKYYAGILKDTSTYYDETLIYGGSKSVNEELTIGEAEQLAEIITDRQQARLLKDTMISMERLKQVPCIILGKTLRSNDTQTIPSLIEEGDKLKIKMDKANEAYEELMTVPNREYGDSIYKAFENMDGLLLEEGIENTVSNQRAVRILAYNKMEITRENINRIKAYDLEVNTLFKKLKPYIAVRIIKEGINPLKTTISKLNQWIDNIDGEYEKLPEEKFSTYLYKLENQDGITKDERKAYIGIYRLLYNIKKTDGAALGAVIKAGGDVTLNNLLSAVKTMRRGSVDAAINDDFGVLSDISFDNESINKQLAAVFKDQNQQIIGEEDEVILDSQEEKGYLDEIIKELSGEVTPEKLLELYKNLSHTEVGQEVANSSGMLNEQLNEGIWDYIKDVPVDKLFEQLQMTGDYKYIDGEDYSEKLNEIRNMLTDSEQAIHFLEDYKVPGTTVNIMLAKYMLYTGNTVFKKLLKLDNKKTDENKHNIVKKTMDLTDKIIDKDSMDKGYEEMGKNVNSILDEELLTGNIDRNKLNMLKSIRLETSFIRRLAKREFYHIPIKTKSGVFSMNLTIIREKNSTNKVSIGFSSNKLGSVKAEFTLKDKNITGYVECNNIRGLEILQKGSFNLDKVRELGIRIKRIDYCLQDQVSCIYSVHDDKGREVLGHIDCNKEKLLYRIAKEVVLSIRAAELEEVKQDSFAS